MILFDYKHTAVRNLMAMLRDSKGPVEVEEGLLRHMIMNSIRAVNSRHRREYGELVLACEGGHVWRRDAFPYYKANRKKGRDKSLIDWDLVHRLFDQLETEIQVYFPYRVVRVPGAEGDDVISTLAKSTSSESDSYLQDPSSERVMIVSSDGDFAQLLSRSNVRLWDPIKGRFIEDPNPQRSLKEKIIRGDSGDGIPNVLSDDDTFVVPEKKQKAIFQKKLDVWLDQSPAEFCDVDKWKRNDLLINFDNTPARIADAVLDKYRQEAGKPKGSVMDYLTQFRLRNLMEFARDF